MDKIQVGVEAVQSPSLISLRLKTLTMCTRCAVLGVGRPYDIGHSASTAGGPCATPPHEGHHTSVARSCSGFWVPDPR
jgi:hypothetical protein